MLHPELREAAGSMNHRGLVRWVSVVPFGLQRCLDGRNLCAAGRELCCKMSELRVQVQAQLFDGFFKPDVGFDLILLAGLCRFEVGENHLSEKLGDDIHRLIHVQILRKMGFERLITAGSAMVMKPDAGCPNRPAWLRPIEAKMGGIC